MPNCGMEMAIPHSGEYCFLAEPLLDFGGDYIIETGFPVFGLAYIFPPFMACKIKRIDGEVKV